MLTNLRMVDSVPKLIRQSHPLNCGATYMVIRYAAMFIWLNCHESAWKNVQVVFKLFNITECCLDTGLLGLFESKRY